MKEVFQLGQAADVIDVGADHSEFVFDGTHEVTVRYSLQASRNRAAWVMGGRSGLRR